MTKKMSAATGCPYGNKNILEYEEKALDCTLWKARFGRGYGPS